MSKKIFNELIKWCEDRAKNSRDIFFNLNYCSGNTFIRFTTKVIDSILPPSDDNKGGWGNGHYIFYEIRNRNNHVSISCVVSPKELLPRGKEICELLINSVGKRVKKENWQYAMLRTWKIYKYQEY